MAEVTIRTIAHEAGVSITTVSQVLNNRPTRVSEETRERVLSVAHAYDWHPNRIAASLKLKETHTIALLAPFTPYGFFSNLVYSVQKYADQAGYLTMVINTFEDSERELKELRLYQSGMFDGVLVAPLADGSSGPVLEEMEREKFPFVCVDRHPRSSSFSYIGSDHRKVGRELTERAIQDGHDDLVFLYREQHNNTAGQERLAGYMEAMAAHGLEGRMQRFTYTFSKGNEGMEEAVGRIERAPGAFFVHSGYYLPFLVHACAKRGWDTSKIHFYAVDGFSLEPGNAGGLVTGQMTLALQDIDQIAALAVRRLVAEIQGDGPGGQNEFVPVLYRSF